MVGKVKNKMNTRMISEISILLAMGFAVKMVSDLVTRTALTFLFIDFLMLTAIVILYRFPKFKVALLVAVIQTVVSGTLFTATDMWFIRPVVVMIAFGIVVFVKRRKWKEQTQFIWACFLTSKLTILSISFIFILILLIMPELLPFGTVEGLTAQSDMFGPNEVALLEDNFKLIIICLLLAMGFIYAYIPAFVHLLGGIIVFKVLKRIERKK